MERQLKKLKAQIPKFLGQIRVLVSLNEIDDVYLSIIKEYQSDQIKFRSNPGNIGGNANITLAFVFAEADEFLWILSDDDMITEDALEYIMPSLDYSCDVVHVGDYEILADVKISLMNALTIPKGAGFGLISVVIFNMEVIKGYLESGFSYLDSSFPHLAILLAALRDKKEFSMRLVSHTSVFTSEELSTHGRGDYSVSLLGFGYLADFFNKRHGKELLNSWIRENWRGFLLAKSKNSTQAYKAMGYLAFKAPKLIFYLYIMKILKDSASVVRIVFRKCGL